MPPLFFFANALLCLSVAVLGGRWAKMFLTIKNAFITLPRRKVAVSFNSDRFLHPGFKLNYYQVAASLLIALHVSRAQILNIAYIVNKCVFYLFFEQITVPTIKTTASKGK